MAVTSHDFTSLIRWTGDCGQGAADYRGYDRTWDIVTPGKTVIDCSNDPMPGGDPSRPNPEDLLLSALAACHMLLFLHLASRDGLVVKSYEDAPLGEGETAPDGAGRFVSATLRPRIGLASGIYPDAANRLHLEVARYCFIARSVGFPVHHDATYFTVQAAFHAFQCGMRKMARNCLPSLSRPR